MHWEAVSRLPGSSLFALFLSGVCLLRQYMGNLGFRCSSDDAEAHRACRCKRSVFCNQCKCKFCAVEPNLGATARARPSSVCLSSRKCQHRAWPTSLTHVGTAGNSRWLLRVIEDEADAWVDDGDCHAEAASC